MKASSKALLGLTVALGLAFFFLGRPAAAAGSEVSSGSSSGLSSVAIAAVKKILSKATKILGIGGAGAASTAGAGAAGAGTAAGAGGAVTGAGSSAAAASAAGSGAASAAGAGALAPAGGLAAAGAVILLALAPIINLFGWFEKEPAWHKEWRESGGLAEFEAVMNVAPASLNGLAEGTYRGSKAAAIIDIEAGPGVGGI